MVKTPDLFRHGSLLLELLKRMQMYIVIEFRHNRISGMGLKPNSGQVYFFLINPQSAPIPMLFSHYNTFRDDVKI